MKNQKICFVSAYEFDGLGRMIKERIWRWDQMSGKMITTQDTKYTFDLAGNTTQILFSDNAGFAYEETRTYARGYQLINANVGRYAADVTVSVSGSYTYDTNNNLLTTKKVDVKRGTTQLTYRDSWTFEFDRKNRLKVFKQSWNDNQTHIWYDGLGRVWQRWEFDTIAEEWASTLKRFVYDGNALAQEIETSYEEEVFSYAATAHDYLRKSDGIRDKAQVGENYEDRYLLTDKGQITARVKRETSSAVVRQELTVSGDRQAGGSTQDEQISNLGIGGGYIEGYGGGTSDDGTKYFDPLIKGGNSHILPALNMVVATKVIAKTDPGGAQTMPAQTEDCGPNCPDRCKILYPGNEALPNEGVRTPCIGCPDKWSDECFKSLEPGVIEFARICFNCPVSSLYLRDNVPLPTDTDFIKMMGCLALAESGGKSASLIDNDYDVNDYEGCFQIHGGQGRAGHDCLGMVYALLICYESQDNLALLEELLGSLMECIRRHGYDPYERFDPQNPPPYLIDCIQLIQTVPRYSLLCAMYLICKYGGRQDEGIRGQFEAIGESKYQCCMDCCPKDWVEFG